jgi:hypothetical protein
VIWSRSTSAPGTRSLPAVASPARTSSTIVLDRDPVREHERLGDATGGAGEHSKGAAAVFSALH